MQQEGLFARNDQPLAERMRPQTLTDYVGQRHILGADTALSAAIAQDKPFSMLLWVPPGCGKTTLALLLARAFDADFVRLSAVFSGVKEVREACGVLCGLVLVVAAQVVVAELGDGGRLGVDADVVGAAFQREFA